MTGKRDNAYYIQALKKNHMHLVREIEAGRMTVSQARKLAGLGANRTRLHELKNAWVKATDDERRVFMDWARKGLPVSAAAGVAPKRRRPAFDADLRIMPWAKARILEILSRRRMTSGDLAAELGLSRLNVSVMMAVHRNTKVKATTAAAVTDWLKKNVSV